MNNAKNTTLFPYLERLLEGEAVEWKTLGEVCKIKNGKDYKHLSNGSVPVYGSGGVMKYVNEAIYSQPSVLIPRKGSLNNLFFVDTPFWNVDTIYYTEINTDYILPKFFYYYLVTLELEKLNLAGGVPSLTQSTLNKLSIPIPPLRVQARIVEILDKFTQLEAELEAELEARKKQYAYYRDQLLNFSQCPPLNVNIEWKTLGEVCLQLRTGLNPRNNFELNTDDASNYYVTVRELGGTELIYSEKTDLINDHALQLINNRSKLKVNDILFSGTGTIGKTAFIAEEPSNWNIKEGVYALTLDTRCVLPMFVLRYLQSQRAIDWIERMAAGGIVRSITMRKLEQLPFPVPPLSEQRRIVDILDRFDTLTNSISEGLPKEIALRRKQYEYYRDALLSFPRPEATA